MMDTEGDKLRTRRRAVRRRRNTRLVSFIIYEAFELLVKHKKLALSVFFLMLEVAALLLHVYEESRRSILLAAFLLSLFSFVTTVFTCFRGRPKVHAEKQLGAVDIGFSVVQLIAAFLAFLGIKIMNNYNDSILLLVFALIAVAFVCAKYENNNYIVSSSSSPSYDQDFEIDLLSAMTNSIFYDPAAQSYDHANQQFDFNRELQYVPLWKKNVERYSLRQDLSLESETNASSCGS